MCEACPEMVNHNDPKEMDEALARAHKRIEILADALLDIRDINAGWTRHKTIETRMETIDMIARDALAKEVK